MFETRLKVLLFVLMFALAIVVARLVDMQVLHADVYRKQAEDALLLPAKSIPAVRGRILARNGEVLASDEPCWDILVHYGVLAEDKDYLRSLKDRFRRQQRYGPSLTEREIEDRLRDEIARMWDDLARFSNESTSVLQERGTDICDRIRRIRKAVQGRRGFDAAVREERMRHAIVMGIDDQQQVAARARFSRYPWVGVEDATRRVYQRLRDSERTDDPLAHVLGALGPVTAEACANDPFAADPYRKYLGNERLGVQGIERVAEEKLRGWRGRYQRNRDGVVIEDTRPRAGGDVTLTIRRDLQDRLYRMLDANLTGERALKGVEDSTGGVIVVLDVQTRDCLALVSYPSYDPNTVSTLYDELSLDAKSQPLRFRAVANRYAPGSIVKPLICLAGLHEGRIDADTRFDCQGAMFAERPGRWRCWPNRLGERMRHGELTAREAIKHSCNIFMYQTGQLLGVRKLTEYFDMAGLGRSAGTGLIEEASGTNPDARWLAAHPERRVTPGMARNLAIGQGELSVTALQTANLIAFYASGKYAPVSLIRAVLTEPVEWYLDIDATHWHVIRHGMFEVVNGVRGTAPGAGIPAHTGYAVCGKTGSAQAIRRPLSYCVTYGDAEDVERIVIVPAATRRAAMTAFTRQYPDCAVDRSDVTVDRWWPEKPPREGRSYSHAWFGGYLQPVDESGQPRWEEPGRIAFAVLVEFGGSGGRVGAPIGKQVAEILIDTLGPDLDPDHPPVWPAERPEVASRGRDTGTHAGRRR